MKTIIARFQGGYAFGRQRIKAWLNESPNQHHSCIAQQEPTKPVELRGMLPHQHHECCSGEPLRVAYDAPCPCQLTTPCMAGCTCVNGFTSKGCVRCASYGNNTGRKQLAAQLASYIDFGNKMHGLMYAQNGAGKSLKQRLDDAHEPTAFELEIDEQIKGRIDEQTVAFLHKCKSEVKELVVRWELYDTILLLECEDKCDEEAEPMKLLGIGERTDRDESDMARCIDAVKKMKAERDMFLKNIGDVLKRVDKQ